MPILQIEERVKDKRLVVISNSQPELTVDDKTDVVLCDASAAHVVINLPLAADVPGKQYVIKKIDSSSNGVAIRSIVQDGNELNGDLFDGFFPLMLAIKNKAYQIVSDGTNYQIIGEF